MSKSWCFIEDDGTNFGWSLMYDKDLIVYIWQWSDFKFLAMDIRQDEYNCQGTGEKFVLNKAKVRQHDYSNIDARLSILSHSPAKFRLALYNNASKILHGPHLEYFKQIWETYGLNNNDEPSKSGNYLLIEYVVKPNASFYTEGKVSICEIYWPTWYQNPDGYKIQKLKDFHKFPKKAIKELIVRNSRVKPLLINTTALSL